MRKITSNCFLVIALITLAGFIPLRAAEQILEGGDAETGQMILTPGASLQVEIQEGSPATENGSKACYKLRVITPAAGGANRAGVKDLLFVDPTKKYRVSADIFIESPDTEVRVSGMGFTSQTKLAQDGDGKFFQLRINPGPASKTQGSWVRWTYTIGPAGSGANLTWFPDILRISFYIQVNGPENAVVYADNLKVELLD